MLFYRQASPTSPEGPTRFDVLHSQLEKSGDIFDAMEKFAAAKRPTELEPLPDPTKPKEEFVEKPIEVQVKRPTIHSPLFEYLDKLILSGRPLQVLHFDMEGASNEDTKNLLSKAYEAKKITEDEYKKMIDILEGSKSSAEASTLIHSGEIFKDLDSIRKQYSQLFSQYKKDLRIKRQKFGSVMKELQPDRRMPLPRESEELIRARTDYYVIRNKKKNYLLQSGIQVSDVLEYEKREDDIIFEDVRMVLSDKEKSIHDRFAVLPFNDDYKMIYQSVLLKSLDIFSETEEEELDLFLNQSETKPENIVAFLESKIPTFKLLVEEEKEKLKA